MTTTILTNLHPGRTAVVLLDDVGLADPVALAAACLLDTRRRDLQPSDREVTEQVSPAVTAFRNSVPRSSSVTLLEDLLASELDVALVALAERLDQIRHAHLWGDLSEARAAHEEASEVYLKMAERTHARLAARYASWCRAFGERYLKNSQGLMLRILDGPAFSCINGCLTIDLRIRHATSISP